MAVTLTTLTHAVSLTDATAVASSTYTPSPNTLLLGVVRHRQGSTAIRVPTMEGNGATWVQQLTLALQNHRVTLFRTMSSAPVSGAATFRIAGTTVQTNWQWEILEFAGVSTASTDGAGAIPQSGGSTFSSGGASTIAISFAPFASSNNVSFSFAAISLTNLADPMTTGVNQELINSTGAFPEPGWLFTQWRPDTSTSIDAVRSTLNQTALGALEIAASSVVAGVERHTDLSMMGMGR